MSGPGPGPGGDRREGKAFAALSREERVALCREVMESLSDLVEGTAPPDLCERVERLLGDCQPYRAYRDTLSATIRLLGECGEAGLPGPREETFRRCVERARRELARGREEGP